jgi:2-polyprenyl-3-methyl-5-hydroxy-6-metoxy-1,4-benzoquinol methylase
MAESDSARTSADAETARRRRDELAARHGAWTAHDIRLAEGVSTRPGGSDVARIRRCLQLAGDLTRRPIDDLRVLDLGALEGQYGVEFALHGATVVAIEGREADIEKARLARDLLGLDRLELRHEDARGLGEDVEAEPTGGGCGRQALADDLRRRRGHRRGNNRHARPTAFRWLDRCF